MLRVDRRLQDERLRSLMLLQVHDELLFEGPDEEIAHLTAMVKSEMEDVEKLTIPLVVDVKQGSNWRDMI